MSDNDYEHKRDFITFIRHIFFYAILGFAFGSLVDLIFRNIRGTPNNRIKCFAVLCAWLLLICVIMYFSLKTSNNQNNLVLDDWVFGTYEGFLFAIGFFNSQTFLGDTAQCALRGKID